MNKPLTELFGAPRSKPETKAENTTKAARTIIDAEAAAKDAKTARLRAARIAKEEQDQAEAAAAAPVVKPVKASRRKTAKA